MVEGSHTIILAAGGTGGHIFPAQALAEVLRARGMLPVLITDRRFAAIQHGAFNEMMVTTIRTGRMGRGVLSKLVGAVGVAFGIVQSLILLMRLRPKVVVGFGGYPSFPTVLAATLLRIPTIIHEQNAVLGRANRVLVARVKKIATSFRTTQFIAARDEEKITYTGNPVRASVRAVGGVPYPELTQDGTMQILVTGGSQGSKVFSTVVPAALALLPVALRARLRVDQQCRSADLEATRAAYAGLGISVELRSFFVDVPARLASAHLVIARSGASTLAELMAAGRPAILVPLPGAMDNHQAVNAHTLEEVGGGWVMAEDGFTPEALAARLEAFLSLPSTLAKAAFAARNLGQRDAAGALADLVFEAMQSGRGSELLTSSNMEQAA